MNEKWTEQEARQLHAIALRLFNHERHNQTQLERMNCGACALTGYEPRGGWDANYKVNRDGPNYAGWARVYVEAGFSIPRKWEKAFTAELHSDNTAYANALQKSIDTFGAPRFS